jgi:hypothetical protein
MDSQMITHGFFANMVAKDEIATLKKDVDSYLALKSYPSYSAEIETTIPSAVQLITKRLLAKVQSILGSDNLCLKCIELHYLPPKSAPIPPHQDNFYHCMAGGEGLKILIPLTDLSAKSGGLYFLDCPSSIGVVRHVPSKVPNFSSYIPSDILRNLKYSKTSYNYHPGDASFHLLNSIHFSSGNQCDHEVMFLVFRYQPIGISPSPQMLKNYSKTFTQHRDRISQ